MVPMHGIKAVEAFHEPRIAAVPAASCSGVSPPARTPGGTPGALAGEDACATSAGQFMVPMEAKKAWRLSMNRPFGVPALAGPVRLKAGLQTCAIPTDRFMGPMHAKKRKQAL